jgi:predicted ABC-type transport system involved in lysophospholipase L1 biosynthesis ATPase subunit
MEGTLSLREVWLSYPRGRRHVVRVLVDISLELHPGEVVAVAAARAQGKTSLLRVAAGLERPDRGSVLLGGQDLWGAPADSARHARARRRGLKAPIVLIGAGAPELEVSVLESVALPLSVSRTRREARALASWALERTGALECARGRWEELSDCERARVAITQGLARGPQVLLADDLTATLDLGEAEQIVGLLMELAAEREMGVLMSVGDMRAAIWAPRRAALADGALVVDPPCEVSARGGLARIVALSERD